MNSDKKRVMIIGQPGSGKSTLAGELGNKLHLPVFYIDHIHWQAGWIEREQSEKDRLCAEVHSSYKWIFEGGNSSTWDERVERADTLIWLDFPLRIRAWRIFFRTIRYYGRSRPDLPEGCPEQFTLEFIGFIWRTRKKGRKRMSRFFDSVSCEKEKYHLRNRSEVEEFKTSVVS